MKYIKKQGSSNGTIVFIHGNSSSLKVFNETLKSDAIKQTKIAIDLPGHGSNNNSYEDLEDFSITNFNRLCTNFINNIDDAIILVGNSFGGHIAIEIAPEIHRLKGLVIFGTPPVKKPINIEAVYMPIKESQVFFMENPTIEAIEAMAKVAVFHQDNEEIIVSDFKNTNPKVRSAIVNDVGNNAFANQYKIFTEIEVPKYIIAGKQDASINLDYLKQVVADCHGTCQLIELDECGHYPSLEQPEQFTNQIIKIANTVF